jgi:hypothetical protein
LLDCKLVEIKPAVVLACKFVNFTALSSQDQDFSRPCCSRPLPNVEIFFLLIVRRLVLVHFNIVQLNGAMHWKCNAYQLPYLRLVGGMHPPPPGSATGESNSITEYCGKRKLVSVQCATFSIPSLSTVVECIRPFNSSAAVPGLLHSS